MIPDVGELLDGLVDREIQTVTGAVNRITVVRPPNVMVATAKSPDGRPVPIAWVEEALRRLVADGEVPIEPSEIGYRSAFIGAVLKTLPGAVVEGGRPPVIRLSGPAGGRVATPYRPQDENVEVAAPAPAVAADPDSFGNGLRAHHRLQNELARLVVANGLEPLSPSPDGPHYDLAWKTDAGSITVVEVKSATEAGEVRQLRMGLGQVLDYASVLQRRGFAVRSVLHIEREPAGAERWLEITGNAGVLLTWPGAEERLGLIG
ncbi:hypothetical protein Ade02nite_66360 [Paractinoplanes deccanensis]|uniref:DUF3883 domain-containing protein n=2 Tax=Paractinoplanes deccanensis TaxID=113561 RepID=A0ABQ3YDI4_9ACTN|nr:hypothetical protein Ade02nite_66360 [Actinoplanes deccanensis]